MQEIRDAVSHPDGSTSAIDAGTTPPLDLAATMEYSRAVVAALPQATVLLFGPDERLWMIEGTLLQEHGYATSELRGGRLSDLLLPTARSVLTERFADITYPADLEEDERGRRGMLSRSRPDFESEKRYIRGDGTLIWVSLHVAPTRGSDGTVSAFFAQIVDLTARKEREHALAQEAADLERLSAIREALYADRLELHAQPITDLRDLVIDDHDLRLVRAIVTMAREMGKRTIAEGVEDAATLQRLRDLGVDHAQGYYLGRPAPVARATSPSRPDSHSSSALLTARGAS